MALEIGDFVLITKDLRELQEPSIEGCQVKYLGLYRRRVIINHHGQQLEFDYHDYNSGISTVDGITAKELYPEEKVPDVEGMAYVITCPLFEHPSDVIWGDECEWDLLDDFTESEDELMGATELDPLDVPLEGVTSFYVMEEGGKIRKAQTYRELMDAEDKRRIALTPLWGGIVEVSTVFLGLDHRFDDSGGDPILFETMIFGGPLHEEQDRYCTLEEALQGHERLWAKAKAEMGFFTFLGLWAIKILSASKGFVALKMNWALQRIEIIRGFSSKD